VRLCEPWELVEGRTVQQTPADARLFTVGHSNHTLEAFLDLLKMHGITAIADVRSVPASGYSPHFNADPLKASLKATGIAYVYLGKELGARREERECYVEGQARYERVAELPRFREGIERVRKGVEGHRVALMCAEKDPLTCHRGVLVCRHLRGVCGPIMHILHDGRLESQDEAEERLLVLAGEPGGDLFRPRSECVEAAYEAWGRRIAYSEGREEADDER
jgi:uncharacterized protein (DUF488 family)